MAKGTNKCTLCKKTIRLIDLFDHLKLDHYIPEENLSYDYDLPFKCDKCNKKLKLWKGLQIHKREYCSALQKYKIKTNTKLQMVGKTWDPPAPITIYCKVQDVPYHTARYHLAKGYSPVRLNRIEEQLRDREYCCETCAYIICDLEDNSKVYICTYKNKFIDTPKESICKSFEPKKY